MAPSPRELFIDFDARGVYAHPGSRSGPGSTLPRTALVRSQLPRLFAELGVASLLDAPCGDGGWMYEVDLGEISYLGFDVVPALVELCQARAPRGRRSYALVDILGDPLPRADLILSRDFLIHLSDADGLLALQRFRASGAAYLLTSSFPARASNPDILTGGFRPVNLERAPFGFPPPYRIIAEGCPQPGFQDKILGLWRMGELPEL